ncbi:MAG: MFS transporter [Candidatus Latescibacteria bacterium]|jgi:MFS family permease|nr:MFS transporter [Candidatus Latescibacterota bacterium]MDP7450534.1 MFS transporter [Candidatus Latescibacterota bacterium]HJP29278.1 MFS transporter [Candidatus Latescibacterota bacterium]
MIQGYRTAWPLFSRDARLFLLSATLAGFSYSGIYFLLANLFLVRLDYDEQFIGVFVATGALSFALSSLPAGVVGRRWGSRRAMTAGYAVLACGLALVSLAPLMQEPWRARWLIATCALRELGNAFYMVNANPFLMEATAQRERGHVFSSRGAVVPLAGFVGTLLGGVLPARVAGWTGRSTEDPMTYLLPLLLGGVLLLPGLLALLSTRGPEAEDPSPRAAPADSLDPCEVAETPRPPRPQVTEGPIAAILIMSLVGSLYICAMAASMSFFNLYMDRDLAVSTSRIGTIIACGQLLAVPVALTMAALARRIGYAATFGFAAAGVALCALPMGLLPLWWAAGAGAIGITVMAGLAFPAITVYQQELVEPDWRPIMSGAYMMALALSWTVMASAGGYLIKAEGYRFLFLLGAGLTTVGVVVFTLYAVRRARLLSLKEIS